MARTGRFTENQVVSTISESASCGEVRWVVGRLCPVRGRINILAAIPSPQPPVPLRVLIRVFSSIIISPDNYARAAHCTVLNDLDKSRNLSIFILHH